MSSDSANPSFFPCPLDYRTVAPVPTPPTMLKPSEVQLLRWLSASVCTGRGEIVDLGPWLGGSTVPLCEGMLINRKIQEKRIYVYDLFQWYPESYEIYKTGIDLPEGASCLPVYEQLVKPYLGYLDITAGDILQQRWNGRPIELLFIDLMKNPDIGCHLAEEFFPCLVPGAFVVHQDYKFKVCYWIHLSMFRLRFHLSPALDLFDAATTVFRVDSVPPRETLRHAFHFESFTSAEIHAAFDFADALCRHSHKNRVSQIKMAREAALRELAIAESSARLSLPA